MGRLRQVPHHFSHVEELAELIEDLGGWDELCGALSDAHLSEDDLKMRLTVASVHEEQLEFDPADPDYEAAEDPAGDRTRRLSRDDEDEDDD